MKEAVGVVTRTEDRPLDGGAVATPFPKFESCIDSDRFRFSYTSEFDNQIFDGKFG